MFCPTSIPPIFFSIQRHRRQQQAMAMDFVIPRYPHPTLRIRAFSFSASIRQQLSLFNLAEVPLGRPFVLRLNNHKLSSARFVTPCINGSEGGRSPRASPRRTAKRGRVNQPETSSEVDRANNGAADQEEIISLFRRIQSSIANGELDDLKENKSPDSQLDDKPAAESVLAIIRNSRKPSKDKPSPKGRSKAMPRRRGPSKRKMDVEVEGIQRVGNFKLTRPPSSFVRRSPIPFPTALRGLSDPLLTSEVSASPAVDSLLLKLEEMKVADLKVLAKSRGVKGYSKLKKKELVDLLRS